MPGWLAITTLSVRIWLWWGHFHVVPLRVHLGWFHGVELVYSTTICLFGIPLQVANKGYEYLPGSFQGLVYGHFASWAPFSFLIVPFCSSNSWLMSLHATLNLAYSLPLHRYCSLWLFISRQASPWWRLELRWLVSVTVIVEIACSAAFTSSSRPSHSLGNRLRRFQAYSFTMILSFRSAPLTFNAPSVVLGSQSWVGVMITSTWLPPCHTIYVAAHRCPVAIKVPSSERWKIELLDTDYGRFHWSHNVTHWGYLQSSIPTDSWCLDSLFIHWF